MRPKKNNHGIEAHFSGHETFPLRQMWLKKAFDRADADGLVRREIFSADSAIAKFGVGRNMVGSIRHWALACDVIRETDPKGPFHLTNNAKTIFADGGLDPYSENPATAWYAHWCLAGRGTRATTWFWLFNVLTSQTFTRDEALPPLSDYAKVVAPGKKQPARATLARDLDTCLRGYAPRAGTATAEEAAEPMLGELGLIEEERKGVFSFRRGPKATLPDALFAWALLDYWDRAAPGETAMTFETVAYAAGAPGRVFKLDEDSVAERLFALGEITGDRLRWTDTAGLRQIHRADFDPARLKGRLLEDAYA